MKNPHKGFIIPLLLIIIATLLVGGGYLYTQNQQLTQQQSNANLETRSIETINQESPTNQPNSQSPAWKTYTDTKYGFSFNYPPQVNSKLLPTFVKVTLNTTACPTFEGYDQGKYPPELLQIQINGTNFQRARMTWTTAYAGFRDYNYCSVRNNVMYQMQFTEPLGSSPGTESAIREFTKNNLVNDLTSFEQVVATFKFVK